jgi:hypothetical protein
MVEGIDTLFRGVYGEVRNGLAELADADYSE